MKVCRRCNSRFDDSQLVCPDDGEFLEDDPAALIGTLLDRTYRIEKLLGKGGMGAVYLGRHTHLRDRVAIKVLPKKLSLNPRFLERFFREGQAARAIRHPNVVAAYDLRTTDDGITYLVFEYVEGISLREAIKQWGIFSPAAAVAVLEPVADALGEAHRMGIIHRDLKPDNIMVSGDRHQPVVKLLDLGIAKLRDLVGSTMARPVDLTVAGQILGTPYYMSPEQWGALSRDGNPAIDGRADVYSLGVVVYELVSGRWPFHGATLAEFRVQHLTAEPPPIGSNNAIPATFETALRVALAKDRDDRYPTPQALIYALKQSLIGLSSLRDDGGARMAPEQHSDPRALAPSQVETGTGSVPYHLTGKPVETDLSQAVDTAVSGTRAEALLGALHSSRFQVRRRLGAGGFGVVYEAFDTERQSDVAVKVLYQADARALYQFKKEFRTLSQLTHQNLVSLYELISDGSQWLFSMERIDGVNFCEYVRGGSRAPDDATESLGSSPAVTEKFAQETVPVIDDSDASGSAVTYVGLRSGSSPSQIERLRDALRQLTVGLMHLHRSSLLHRDVKPSNVLVDTTGRVVLLDFGIVGELSPDGLLRAADVFGTPVYMSPEQARGGDVTEASDWYSVGVILYEALCGAPPFAGSLQEVLLQKQMSAPPAPGIVVSDVPEYLDRLCVDLLNLDPSQRPTANSILERLGPASGDAAPKPRAAGAEGVGIVGRDDCLQKLRDALDEVRAGTPVVALVHGGSGMGKTTLVRGFLEDLRRDDPDIVLLEGRCYEQEAVPYKALDSVVDALSQYLQGFSPRDVALHIPQDFDALTRLFPVLRRVDVGEEPKRPRPLIRDSQELRNRASRALRDLVGRLGARRLVVMAIDDLQWSDMDSKAILDDIFRPPRQPPLLFVASYRSEEVATNRALREFVSGCRSTDGVRVIDVEVGNLSREASEQLALEILDSDTASRERAVEIAAEAQGNPYFVIELARFAQQGDRPALLKVDDSDSGDRVTRAQVDSMIRLRVEALPAPVRRLLETTAVAGQPVPLKVATRAAEIERDESAMLARLRSEHLIRVREAGQRKEIESYHDRIRETVVAAIDESRLKAYHLGLAEAWEQFGEADAETLARHYYEAGMPQQALGFVIAAANKAAQALAFERAAGFYARALEFDGAGDVDWQDIRVRLAQSLANAGMGAEAAKAFLEAAAGAQPSERLDLERLAAEKYISSGYIDEGLAVLHSVLARIGIGNPGNPLSTLVRLIFYSLLVSLRGYRFVEKPAERLSSSELLRVDTCWSVVLGFSMVDPVRHVYFQKRHVLFALGAGDPRRAARALAFEGALLTAGKGRARLHAREIMEQSKELAERAGDPHALGLATLWAGGAAWLRGDWKICADLTRQAELIFRQQCVGVASERVTSEVFMLAALVWMGELHAHEELFPQLLQEARGRGDRYAEATLILLTYRHVLLLAADEPERAEQELEYAMSRWSQEGFHLQHFWAVFGRIEIALYEDRLDRAWRLATEMWPALSKSFLLRLQTVHIFARHLRARCALALLASEYAGDRTPDVPSRRSLIRAVERDIRAIERESADWGRGLAGLLRAGLYSAVGKPSAATDALRRAAQTLDASNMNMFASAARYRLGQMNDDGKSQDVGENALARLLERGVTRVDAMVNVLAPGAWRRTEAVELALGHQT